MTRKAVETHKRKRVKPYAKKARRTVTQPMLRLFLGFPKALVKYLSVDGAVATAHKGIGVNQAARSKRRKPLDPAAPKDGEWNVVYKGRSLGEFFDKYTGQKMYDLGAVLAGCEGIHFINAECALLLRLMKVDGRIMSMLELLQYGKEAKIILKEMREQALLIANKDVIIVSGQHELKKSNDMVKDLQAQLKQAKDKNAEVANASFSSFMAGGTSKDDARDSRIGQLGVTADREQGRGETGVEGPSGEGPSGEGPSGKRQAAQRAWSPDEEELQLDGDDWQAQISGLTDENRV